MKKHPIDLTKEDLATILQRNVNMGIGKINSETVTDIISGKVVECGLAANSPNLPVNFTVETINGTLKKVEIFEVKWIQEI
jgi:hypothetical protein